MPYRGLAGRTPASSYADILQIGNDGDGLPNSGIISVCDGAGNESTVKMGQSQASIDFNGGILKNAIIQGGCEALTTTSLSNGHSYLFDLFNSKNVVVSMTEKDAGSTMCTNCCPGTSTMAGINVINLNFTPSLSLAASELGYTPAVGGRSSITFVIPASTITNLCRISFLSDDGTVLGDQSTCLDPTLVRFATYDIYTIPVSGSYRFIVKQVLVVS